MCSEQERPAQVTYSVFWSLCFQLCLLGVEGKQEGQGRRVGREPARGVVGSHVTALGLICLCFLAFLKGLDSKGLKMKKPQAASLDSEFRIHSSPECPL